MYVALGKQSHLHFYLLLFRFVYKCLFLVLVVSSAVLDSRNSKLFNGPTPDSFGLFWSFQTNNIVFKTSQKMSCPCSIVRWDSNPWPLKHEPSPITSRPGLPPIEAFGLTTVWKDLNWILKCPGPNVISKLKSHAALK